ncbi:unnamed protein product, partial [Ectocarpus sp. 8 AP-2014]
QSLFYCCTRCSYTGGPLETVVHERTGFLCGATAEAFGSAIVRLARDPSLGGAMGERGRRRVQNSFSMEVWYVREKVPE